MKIRKAVITAAGRGVRLYPAADTVHKGMLPLFDRDGLSKPVLQIIAEEALDSGIEEICVVCAPGDEEAYRRRFDLLRKNLLEAHEGIDWAQEQAERIDNLVRRLRFAEQESPRGYGHAVYCSRGFVGEEPFVLMLGDHLYVSADRENKRCVRQLIEVAAQQDCSIAAVQATREHLIAHYGTVRGRRLPDQAGCYRIERILEKPPLSRAELELQTPGLRVGHYLCFFGMHVLTHSIFEILAKGLEGSSNGELPLTPALQELAERETFMALEVRGARYDIGVKLGMLQAQIALGLAGSDRERMLSLIVELLAEARSQQSQN